MDYSYAWHGASRTPSKSKANTPSRSSRASGFLNLTHYNAYTRSDGVIFQVGDVVQVWEGAEYAPAQIWLDPYKSYGTRSSQSIKLEEKQSNGAAPSTSNGTPSTSNRKPKGRKAKVAQREQEEEELIDDGLDDSVKFGIVIDLLEDERENARAAIHWLARPRLLCFLFGNNGAREEGLDECHPKELVYTFDPSEDSTKNTTNKSSRAEDIIDVSYILSKLKVVSSDAFSAIKPEEEEDTQDEENEPTYFIRKAMNTKAEQGEGWFYDIEWQEVYDRALTSGNWELQTGLDDEEAAKSSKGRKGGKGKGKGKEKAPTKKVVRKVVKEVAKDLPKLAKRETPRASRASSVDTEMEMEERSSGESSEEEDEATSVVDAEAYSDKEDQSEQEEEDLPEPSSSEDEALPEAEDNYSDEEEDDVFGSRTASGRKRKNQSSTGTPAKRRRTGGRGSGGPVMLKPSAATVRKAAARAERQQQRLLERQARRLKPRTHLAQQGQAAANGRLLSPFEKARAMLHVGATPDYLPCRDEEYAEIEAYLEDAIDEGVGSCIYIAGVPGTGKTATVRSVVSSLRQRADNKDIKPFRFLEVNGMKITDPAQSFTILWEFISGNRTSPKQALSALETHFKTPSPGRDTCVVLVDELDQLVTKKQEVIYNFFNWPNQAHSRLIVLAIANTMDLPERELSNKINSRLGSNRINFTPYDKNQLIEILTTRMDGFEGVFAKDAIGLVAGKVAGVTGDARRALDICRRAVEKVEAENSSRGEGGKKLVTAADIVVVHKEMTSSGLLLFVSRAGLHQRIMLLALSRAIRKVGVADEVEFGDVIRWHLDFCRQTALSPMPTHPQLFSILQALADMKLVTTEGAKLDYFQRVQANVRDDELELVLKKEGRFKHYLR